MAPRLEFRDSDRREPDPIAGTNGEIPRGNVNDL